MRVEAHLVIKMVHRHHITVHIITDRRDFGFRIFRLNIDILEVSDRIVGDMAKKPIRHRRIPFLLLKIKTIRKAFQSRNRLMAIS